MHHAAELRQETGPAEVKLWYFLRDLRSHGINFRRQHAIGPYIADFCAPRRKLVIEVDGAYHQNQQEYDSERTEFLNAAGYPVLRFWNEEVQNKFEKVKKEILEALEVQMGKG